MFIEVRTRHDEDSTFTGFIKLHKMNYYMSTFLALKPGTAEISAFSAFTADIDSAPELSASYAMDLDSQEYFYVDILP